MKKLAILLILSLFLVSCSYNKKDNNIPKNEGIIVRDSLLSVWAVYWDLQQASSELSYMKASVGEISYFSAYFDKNSNLFLPENIAGLHLSLKAALDDSSMLHYLSVVNDKINSDGSSSLKDKELLYHLLASEKERNQHIANLVDFSLKNGYDGLEIDYEGLKDDKILWPYFLEFCASLYEALTANGLKMRVVLEPSAPIGKYSFPEGPTYVMMCYNLYGLHSGPGPKADREFLQKLSLKMQALPGKTNFALATGGFDWYSNGDVVSITEEDAIELIHQYKIIPIRDANSKAMTFIYTDNNNIQHEVWFADGETLSSWIEILKNENNQNFSLWRLNGNVKESLLRIDAIFD